MNEKQRVRITLESLQNGQRGEAQMFQGEFYPKDKSYYIRYEEEDELHGSVRTLVRWSGEELKLTRRGGIESEQVFAIGSRRMGSYGSQHLSFVLETETTELTVKHDSNSGLPLTLQWSYTLYIEHEESGRFELRLHIQEDNH